MRYPPALVAAALVAAVAGMVPAVPAAQAPATVPLTALPAIDPAKVLAHVKALASDAFEGRAPGTAGEATTVAYLVDAFKALGLRPGNPDGTFVQKVPLVGITPAAAPLTIAGGLPAGRRPRSPGAMTWWPGPSA